MEVFIKFLLVMCWCFKSQYAMNLYGHRTEGWARRSPDCQSQMNPGTLNKIFRNFYKELERVPFCACIQMCANHPLYCYPNGCLKSQLKNARRNPDDKEGNFAMGRDYPSRIGSYNDVGKSGAQVKEGEDDLPSPAITIKPEQLEKPTYLQEKITLHENNRTRFTVGEKLRMTKVGSLNQKLDKKSRKIGKIWTRQQSMTQQPFRYKVLNQFLPKSETKVITIAILPKSDYLKKREKSNANAPTGMSGMGNSYYFLQRKLKTNGRNNSTVKGLEDFLEQMSMKDFFVKRMNISEIFFNRDQVN